MRKALAFIFVSLSVFASCKNTQGAPAEEVVYVPIGFPQVGDVSDAGIDITNEKTICGIRIVWSYLDQLATFTNLTGNDLVMQYAAEARSDYALPSPYFQPWRLKARESKVIAHMVRRGGEVTIRANDGKNPCGARFVLGR